MNLAWRWRHSIVLTAAGAAALAAWIALAHRPERVPPPAPGRVTRLTNEPGLELDPALSPDGLTLAYSAGPPGRTRIQLRDLATGRTRGLTEPVSTDPQRWPQWSPDGSQIVFHAGRAPLAGGAREDPSTLYVVAAAGGVPRRLFEAATARQGFSPSWFPNQREIVFSGTDGIYAVAASGEGGPRRLVHGNRAHSPRWSPDARWLAFVEGSGPFTFGEHTLGSVTSSRLVLHPSGSRARLALTDGNGMDTNPVWLPDSRTLLYITARGGGRDVSQVRVSPLGMVEGEAGRLTSGAYAHTFSVTADGRLLAYASYPPDANIWSIPIPSSGAASIAGATPLTSGSERIEKLAMSPDGRWLAFDSDRDGQVDVWKLPAGGGPPERITRSAEDEFVNDWSPDGRELVVHTTRNGQRDLLLVSADGLRTEPVAGSLLREEHAAWGPDGNSIVFDAPPRPGERVQAFVTTRPSRGAPWSPARQITRNGSGDPKWSRDGRLIAFCVDDELRVIQPDGSGERVVATARGLPDLAELVYPVWSRDSRTIYFRGYDRAGRSSLWSVAPDGTAPTLLVRFDDPSRRSVRREFATDGQRFYFTIARDESDIWLLELVRR